MERTKIRIYPAKVEGARGLFKWAVFGEYEKAGMKQRHQIGFYRFLTKRGATRYAEMILQQPQGFGCDYEKGWGKRNYPRKLRGRNKKENPLAQKSEK